MAADLSLPVHVLGMPIVREADGLAMSSRNSYLSPTERQGALCLSRALMRVREMYAAGERSTAALKDEALAAIAQEPLATLDYLELRDGTTLEPLQTADHGTLLALAVKLGQTRLIDNTLLGEEL
jgi:pantoate--beta-alanine ligase